jgi:hypothetical protein
MRYRFMGFVTALALVAAMLVPASASAAPLGPKSDAVVGGGKTFSDIFSINAIVNPNGKIMGHINAKNVLDFVQFSVEGTVNCLNIIGNRASIGGELSHFDQEGWVNPEQYHGWLFFVEDNGNQQGVPDKISYQFVYVNPVTTCPNPTVNSAYFELLEGNINVTKSN